MTKFTTSGDGDSRPARFARLGRLAREVIELHLEHDDEVDIYRVTVATAALERDLEEAKSAMTAGGR